MKINTLILSLIFLFNQAYGLIDLEEGIQDFVLETRKLEIPGYPQALNPSIIRWKGELLMSFRIIPDRKQKYNSEIGVVWLDEDFRPVSTPQILKLNPPHIPSTAPSRAEDARLIDVGGTLYLVYDDNRDEKISKAGFRVYVAKLEVFNRFVVATEIEAIVQFEGESPQIREKNWVPFVYQNELLLAYSLSPHLIFRYLPGTGSCETLAKTEPCLKWDWGILRGGTPGIKIDNQYYLSFFHSSIKMKSAHATDQEVLHYFMGAYTFSSEPPFELTRISPCPIVGKNFYHGEVHVPYWHPVRVVYPVGFIHDQRTVSVFYGRQDHEIWVVKLDKKGLLNSLIPVKN